MKQTVKQTRNRTMRTPRRARRKIQTQKKAAVSLFAALLVLMLMPFGALAEGGGTLSINYPYDDTVFHIFRVAGAAEDGGYRLEGDFAGYDVEIPGESRLDTAATLTAFAARDGIEPLADQTLCDGTVAFFGLEEGLYLVTGDELTLNGKIYTPVPFLTWIASSGTVTAQKKFDVREEAPEKVSYKVEKIWKDDGGEKRPVSVEVQLLKDGAVYGGVKLDEENGWTYTWDDLDAGANWQVAEKDVPENYTVSVSRHVTVFTVTNTFHKTEEPPPYSPPGDEVAKTGDTAEIEIYVWIAGASLIVAVLVVFLKRRKKNRGSRH